jgi:hypothetical protein
LETQREARRLEHHTIDCLSIPSPANAHLPTAFA